MSDTKQNFVDLIKKRSEENKQSIEYLFSAKLFGNCLSILRQELDSFIRVIYLGRIKNIQERERLMNQTLSGDKWTELTAKNKWRPITDREMVEKSNEIRGYIQYVYKFGCAFIHLSDYHNYENENPFDKIDITDRCNIAIYLQQYHNYSIEDTLTIASVSSYIPDIFKKISGNMACYFQNLLNDDMIEM